LEHVSPGGRPGRRDERQGLGIINMRERALPVQVSCVARYVREGRERVVRSIRSCGVGKGCRGEVEQAQGLAKVPPDETKADERDERADPKDGGVLFPEGAGCETGPLAGQHAPLLRDRPSL
jgi:hypothetical protein